MAITLEIKGIEEVIKKLNSLEPKISEKLQRRGMRRAGALLADEMRARAPYKFGELREGIKINTRRKKWAIFVNVESTNFKTWFIEYGHALVKPRGMRQGGGTAKKRLVANYVKVGYVPPNPFVRQSFEAKGEEAARIIEAEIIKAVEEITG